MSKRIDRALKELIKALRKHAKAVDAPTVRAKHLARANTRLRNAIDAYAHAVYHKAKVGTPFSETVPPELEDSVIKSLAAERDSFLAKRA
jgi:hypothetical protein